MSMFKPQETLIGIALQSLMERSEAIVFLAFYSIPHASKGRKWWMSSLCCRNLLFPFSVYNALLFRRNKCPQITACPRMPKELSFQINTIVSNQLEQQTTLNNTMSHKTADAKILSKAQDWRNSVGHMVLLIIIQP